MVADELHLGQAGPRIDRYGVPCRAGWGDPGEGRDCRAGLGEWRRIRAGPRGDGFCVWGKRRCCHQGGDLVDRRALGLQAVHLARRVAEQAVGELSRVGLLCRGRAQMPGIYRRAGKAAPVKICIGGKLGIFDL